MPVVGDRVMVLKDEWLRMILNGTKTVESRGQKARLGHVWLGSDGQVLGSAKIVQCQELSEDSFASLASEHCVLSAAMPYKHTWGLWLEDVEILVPPEHYFRWRGAVGWNIFRRESTDAPRKVRRTVQKDVKGGGSNGQGQKRKAICSELPLSEEERRRVQFNKAVAVLRRDMRLKSGLVLSPPSEGPSLTMPPMPSCFRGWVPPSCDVLLLRSLNPHCRLVELQQMAQ